MYRHHNIYTTSFASPLFSTLGACPSSTAGSNVPQFAMNAIIVAAPANAIDTINAVWIPFTYALRIIGTSVAVNTFRISVAPVPMTLGGLMPASDWRRYSLSLATKALWPAETRKAPPMVWTTAWC